MKLLRPVFFSALLVTSATLARANIVVSVEAAGVQQSSQAGAIVEDFADLDLNPSAVGTYSGGASIWPAGTYGAAGGAGYYFYTNGSSGTLTFDSAQSYFGLWWSAMDATNELSFYKGGTLLHTYTIAEITPLLTPAYWGNPNDGSNTDQAYAFVNFAATGSDYFTSVVFSGESFESDNHTIAPSSTHAVPEGGSTMALTGLSLLGLAGLSRRLRQARK